MHIHLSSIPEALPPESSPLQTVEIGSRTRCVCSAVRRVDRVLNRLYDEALRPSGLANTQYALLSILSRTGRPLSHGELAAMQEMAGTTLSRNLKPLVRDGLVRIAPGDDRRTRFVTITEAGETVLEDARPRWRSVQERVVAEVGEERVERLLGELDELLGQLRAADSHAVDTSRS
jgi:DNA-binding MarR family transcriptional regulator